MTIFLKNKHTLQIEDFYFKCCIGKNGTSKKKKEGDKKTPMGIFNIQHLYFRKDKLKKPETSLKCIEIKKNMWWCDDVNYSKKYNIIYLLNKEEPSLTRLACKGWRTKQAKTAERCWQNRS